MLLQYISMSENVVAKFGGTSMAQPEVVAGIVESRPDQRVVIVSAPGIDDNHPEKMTDSLIRLGEFSANGDPAAAPLRDEIIDRFDSLYDSLGSYARSFLRSHAKTLLVGDRNPRLTRSLLGYWPLPAANYYHSLGETLSATYFSHLIGGTAVAPAIQFGRGSSKIALDRTKREVNKQIDETTARTIVPGYFGLDYRKNIHLLGRGGSDRSGAIYARALGWDYENWTDVNGIYSADPRAVPGAFSIPELTREEVREGAHGGSGVLQGDAIIDLNGSPVVTTVKNTFNPQALGTRIVPELSMEREHPVIAVTGREDLVKIDIHDLGMADRSGYVAQLLTKLAKLGLAFEHMPAAQDSFGITIHAEADNPAVKTFEGFARLHRLSPRGSVATEECGAVYVVGEGLRDTLQLQKVSSRVLALAADMDMPVLPVVGTRSPSLALISERGHVGPLVKAIHETEIESAD